MERYDAKQTWRHLTSQDIKYRNSGKGVMVSAHWYRKLVKYGHGIQRLNCN